MKNEEIKITSKQNKELHSTLLENDPAHKTDLGNYCHQSRNDGSPASLSNTIEIDKSHEQDKYLNAVAQSIIDGSNELSITHNKINKKVVDSELLTPLPIKPITTTSPLNISADISENDLESLKFSLRASAKRTVQPNLCSWDEILFPEIGENAPQTLNSDGATMLSAIKNGELCWLSSRPTGDLAQLVSKRLHASHFNENFACSLPLFESLLPLDSMLSVMVKQLRGDLTEIAEARHIQNFLAADLPTLFEINGAIDPASVFLDFCISPNLPGKASLHFGALTWVSGRDPSFRNPQGIPPLDLKNVSLTGIPTTPSVPTNSSGMQIANASLVDAKNQAHRHLEDSWAWSKNVFTDPTFENSGASVTWSGGIMPIVNKHGRRCIETPSSLTATSRATPLINISEFSSGRISASVQIEEKGLTVSSTSIQVRIRFYAADGVTTILIADQIGSDNPLATTFYTRYTSVEAISHPTWLAICTGIMIPNGAAYCRIDFRIQTAIQMYVTNIVVREGYLAAWSNTSSGIKTGGGATTAGTGGAYPTISQALDAIGGSGTITLEYDRSYGTDQWLDTTKISGPLQILGRISNTTGKRPRILLSNTLPGIQLVSGLTRVYRVPTTITQTPPWAWIHDLPDASTLININRRRPHHGGRLHRLPSTRCMALIKNTLDEALIFMNTSNDPYCFYNSGYLYLTGPNGLNLSDKDIRIDGTRSFVGSGFTVGSKPSIEICGIEFLYGGVDLRAFRRSVLDDVSSLGSRSDAIRAYGSLRFGSLETAGAGNWSDSTGDGLNCHVYSDVEGEYLYSHDNQDDAESAHEFSRSRISNSYAEYNGGAAFCPAYGCDAVYTYCESYQNQMVPGRKLGAFQVTGLPSQGSPVDDGFDTIAIFRACVSDADEYSFYDKSQQLGSVGKIKAICEDCLSINPRSGVSYDVYSIRNCRSIGASMPKTAKVIIEPTGTLIT